MKNITNNIMYIMQELHPQDSQELHIFSYSFRVEL